MKSIRFLKINLVHILVVILSIIPVLLSEGKEIGLFINNFYRIILTVGVFYLCALLYDFIIGKIVSHLLLLLLSINFFIALVSRAVYKSNFDEAQATSVLLSNFSEATGMAKGYIAYILAGILYFVFSELLLKNLIKRNKLNSLSYKYKVFISVNVLLLIGLGFDAYQKRDRKKFNKHSPSFVFLQKTAFFNAARFQGAIDFMKEAKTISEKKVDYSGMEIIENNIENIVVILGESARKDAFSLYGNSIKTSPNLDKRIKNLLVYENAVAPAPYTILAVPIMLSMALPTNDYSQYQVADNVLNIANHTEAWQTYWFSSHEKVGVHVSAITAIAKFAKVSDWHQKNYDEFLVPMLEQTLKDESSKRLIILHTMGSHYPVTDRYPKEYNVFKENKKGYINEYYNSIYYTDHVIEQIIKLLENTSSVVIYAADHAQIDNKTMFTHHMSKKGLDVPFFIWHSDYVDNDFKKTEKIKDYISTSDMYEIIKKYLGVITTDKKPKNTDLKAISGDMKMSLYSALEDGDQF